MATKDLARTAIEGGRAYRNCWDRRHSHARVRSGERNVEASLRYRTDFDDLIMPERERVPVSFHDKLSAPERWLARQSGRPWSLVRSELFARFDRRTTAGRHVDCVLWRSLPPWCRERLAPSAAGPNDSSRT
jgi:hypothetical protein